MCEEAGIELRRVPGRDRRPDGRSSTRENDWVTCLTVEQLKKIWEPGAEGQDHELEPGRPELPGRGAGARRPRHRLGHLRLLHRRGQRRGGREPRRLHRQRGRQRHRPGGRRRAGRRSATSATRTSRRTRTRSRPSRSTAATAASLRALDAARTGATRRSRGRCSSTSRTSRIAGQPQVNGFVEYFLNNLDRASPRDAQFIPVHDDEVDDEPLEARDAGGPSRTWRRHDTTAGAQPAPIRLRAEGRRWGEDWSSRSLLGLCALVSVATTIGIIIALVEPVDRVLPRGLDPRLLLRRAAGRRSSSRPRSACSRCSWGRWSSPSGPASSLCRCGLGAAIYMSEYARPRVRNILKPALEVLAGIPTVVFGFFALTFFTPLLQDIGSGRERLQRPRGRARGRA